MKKDYGIGYQMTKKMFDAILATRNNNDKTLNPYTYVANYLNEQSGLKGTIRYISIAG